MTYFGVLLATIFLVLLFVATARIRARRAEYGRVLDDDHMRQIEQEGWVVLDADPAPLDLDEIEEAEREFWIEEQWDEGEEW